MGNQDHVLGAFGADAVHRLLHGLVQSLAGLVLEEAVNKITRFIHEIGGRGGTEGVRRRHADKPDLDAVKFPDGIGLENQLAFLVEVAADIFVFCPFRQLQELLHAVIEIMVAGNGDVISHFVHDIDNRFAAGHGAHRFALQGVTVVHQQDIIVLRKIFLCDNQAGIAPVRVNTAVNITGKQNHQRFGQCGRSSFFRPGTAQQQSQAQQQSDQFFHSGIPPMKFL